MKTEDVGHYLVVLVSARAVNETSRNVTANWSLMLGYPDCAHCFLTGVNSNIILSRAGAACCVHHCPPLQCHIMATQHLYYLLLSMHCILRSNNEVAK